MFSSGLNVGVYGFFNSCREKIKKHETLNLTESSLEQISRHELVALMLTECVRGSQGARPRVLVGLRVAGGQRFGHGCGGEFRGVAGPSQGELQRGTLGETLERRQTLQTDGGSADESPRHECETTSFIFLMNVSRSSDRPFHRGWSPRSPSSC